jgi:hypothetical protein
MILLVNLQNNNLYQVTLLCNFILSLKNFEIKNLCKINKCNTLFWLWYLVFLECQYQHKLYPIIGFLSWTFWAKLHAFLQVSLCKHISNFYKVFHQL